MSSHDIRKWGGIIGTNPADAATNDSAIASAIASGTPVISFPGPVVISQTIELLNRPIVFIGTSPRDDNAGGLYCCGAADPMIKLINGSHHIFERMRFYGQADLVTQCPLVFKLVYNRDLSPGSDHQTRTTIRDCLFQAPDNGILQPFTSILQTILEGSGTDGGTDLWVMENCYLRGFTGIAIDVFNTQSVGWRIDHCVFDGRGSTQVDYGDTGIRCRADGQVNDTFFNRIRRCINLNQGNRLHVNNLQAEHCSQMLIITNPGAKATVLGGHFNISDDAYVGSSTLQRRFVDARSEQFHMEGMEIRDQLVGEPQPHLFLGNSGANRADIKLIHNNFWTLDHIDSEVAGGSPSQSKRRFFNNVGGIRFLWRGEDGRKLDKEIGAGNLNID